MPLITVDAARSLLGGRPPPALPPVLRGSPLKGRSLRRLTIDDQPRPILLRLGRRPEPGRLDFLVIQHRNDRDRLAGLQPIPQTSLPGLVRLEIERVRVPGLGRRDRPVDRRLQSLELLSPFRSSPTPSLLPSAGRRRRSDRPAPRCLPTLRGSSACSPAG